MDVREEVRQPLDKPFFEEIYLDAFDDVAKAVAQKVHSSARHHFMSCGLQEGRLHNKFYTQAFNEAERKAVELDFSLELCKFTTSKHFTIAGWAADSKYRLSEVEIITEFGELLERFEVSRYRRQDVAQAKGIPAEYPYGFFAAGKVSGALPEVEMCIRDRPYYHRFYQSTVRAVSAIESTLNL